MGYFDRLITSNTVQESVQEQQELNFENENSIEQRELAHQDLIAAKSLAESSKKSDDKHIKKCLWHISSPYPLNL